MLAAACCFTVILRPVAAAAPPSSTGAAAVTAAHPSNDTPTLLQDWDDGQRKLLRETWDVYMWTAALGKDDRGRTISDDVDDWVMTADVRQTFRSLRERAVKQLQQHDEQGARDTLNSGKPTFDEEQRRIGLIRLYWEHHRYLQRDRALWLHSVTQAPPEIASTSKAQISAMEADLARGFSPGLKAEVLSQEIVALKEAYNLERLRLAAVVSDREIQAGHVIEHRTRELPCPDPAESAAAPAGTGNGPSAKEGATSAHLLSTPPPGLFYPDEARRGNIGGRVILKAAVNPDGCMTAGDVIRSSGAPEIDAAALDLAERSKYSPARKDGRPIAAELEVLFKFQLTDADSGPSQPPVTQSAESHARRGAQLLSESNFEGAIAELDQAVRLNPTDPMALANRGMAHVWKREDELARQDFNAAATLEPRNYVAIHGRGMLAVHAGKLDEALAAFTQALEVKGDDEFALNWRAETYLRRGDPARALADWSEILRIKPDRLGYYTRRAFVLRALHRPDEAIAQAREVTAASPNKGDAWLTAAHIYEEGGKHAQAVQAFDKAVELQPSANTYRARAQHRASSDLTGRRADADAALKVDPRSVATALLLIQIQTDSGDYSAAVETATQALAANPGNVALLLRRAIAYRKNQQSTEAEEDLTAARAKATSASQLNTFCWSLATSNLELPRALSACEAALAMAPLEPAYLDSRAFVLLRMGRNNDSSLAYDRALKARPLSVDSLYGRSLARRALGDKSGADKDLQWAVALDAAVAERYSSYGFASP